MYNICVVLDIRGCISMDVLCVKSLFKKSHGLSPVHGGKKYFDFTVLAHGASMSVQPLKMVSDGIKSCPKYFNRFVFA